MPGLNLGDKKVFSAGGAAGEAAQHGQLAHMGERIGYRPLEELLDRRMQRLIGGEIGVKCLERVKETPLFLFLGLRFGGVPTAGAIGHAQRPVEKVAHVGQNLHRLASDAGKTSETLRRAF